MLISIGGGMSSLIAGKAVVGFNITLMGGSSPSEEEEETDVANMSSFSICIEGVVAD